MTSEDVDGARVFREAAWRSVARHYQLVLGLAAVIGVLALVGGFVIGQPLGGGFVCVGLVLGGYNARRLWTETTSLKGDVTDARKAMGLSSLRRLGLVTLIAFLFALAYRQSGWAVFMGLVLFQLLMMTLLLKPLRTVVTRSALDAPLAHP